MLRKFIANSVFFFSDFHFIVSCLASFFLSFGFLVEKHKNVNNHHFRINCNENCYLIWLHERERETHTHIRNVRKWSKRNSSRSFRFDWSLTIHVTRNMIVARTGKTIHNRIEHVWKLDSRKHWPTSVVRQTKRKKILSTPFTNRKIGAFLIKKCGSVKRGMSVLTFRQSILNDLNDRLYKSTMPFDI